MKKLGLTMLVLFAVSGLAMANTIGATLNHGIDSDFGFYGDYEKQFTIQDKDDPEVKKDIFHLGLEGTLQSGVVYLGNLDIAGTFSLGAVGFRIENNNLLKGSSLDNLANTAGYGGSLVVPVDSLEFAIGIFGKSGNPLETVYELKDVTDPDSVQVKDTGITIKEHSSLNVSLQTEFDKTILGQEFEMGLRGLFEVLGEGEKIHQLIIDLETGGDFFFGSRWTLQSQVIGQLYGDKFEYQPQFLTGVEWTL